MEKRGLSLALNQVYFVSVAAITNYHELCGLKQHTFILSQFYGLQKSVMYLSGLKSRC